MQIINVQANAQHFSYASDGIGGKTLNPGQSSSDLPLHRMQLDIFWKDLNSGKIQIRLNEDDKYKLQRMLDEDKKAVVVKQLPPPPPKPPKKQPRQPKPIVQPGPKVVGVTAAPDFGEPAKPLTDEMIKSGAVSLADLEKANRVSGIPIMQPGEANLTDINTFMKSKV